MNNTIYLLSERFDYGKTIHADAGPGYARRHRWATAPLSALSEAARHGPVIIDNRVTEEETVELTQKIPKLRRHPIYVKVVDPYWECVRQPYYHWLLTLTHQANVCFVGPYQATAMTGLIKLISGPARYLQIPYAYEEDRELPIDSGRRKGFLAFTGATHAEFYPERVAMLRTLRRHWWTSRKVTILPHPGYPDIGQTSRHNVTGEQFLRFLAGHRFMYLEPSREGLEFLKYSECAYAGCVPAGRPPESFGSELRDLILTVDSGDIVSHLRALRSWTDEACRDRAQAYRKHLKAARSVQVIEEQLRIHWRSLNERLANA